MSITILALCRQKERHTFNVDPAPRKSMILLKNNGLLPLDRRRIKRIAVIGPNADSVAALLGNYNGDPSNPITFYHSTDDLPDFRDYSMENRTYRYFEGQPLFTFGHGLSYTRFEYSQVATSSDQMATSSDQMAPDGSLMVRVRVSNVGDRAGDEVVQLYVRHLDAPVVLPRHTLAGFARISLEKGKPTWLNSSYRPPHCATGMWSVMHMWLHREVMSCRSGPPRTTFARPAA